MKYTNFCSLSSSLPGLSRWPLHLLKSIGKAASLPLTYIKSEAVTGTLWIPEALACILVSIQNSWSSSLVETVARLFQAQAARKQESEAFHLVKHWTSFTEVRLFISRMALHFAGLALMPLWVSMKPRNLSASIVKAHFWGFSLMLWR